MSSENWSKAHCFTLENVSEPWWGRSVISEALSLKSGTSAGVGGWGHLSRLTKWSLWPPPTLGPSWITDENGHSSFSLILAQQPGLHSHGKHMLCEGLKSRFGERQYPRESLFPYSLSWVSSRRGGAGAGCRSGQQLEGEESRLGAWSSDLSRASFPSCLQFRPAPSSHSEPCLERVADNASLILRGRCHIRLPISVHQTEGLSLRGRPSSNTNEHRMFYLTYWRSCDLGAGAILFFYLVPLQMKQKCVIIEI